MRISALEPLSYDELILAFKQQDTHQPGQILEWITSQDVDFVENQFSLAGKEIFRFQASTQGDPGLLYSFGRSESRKMAAIKASAELIERVVYQNFVRTNGGLNLTIKVRSGSWQVEDSSRTETIERSFHNSNGWAVDFSVEKAIERALREALERHVLLFSFIKDGWHGFFQVDQTKVSHFDFRSLISKYSVAGFSAGLGICQCPNFHGASFGYLCDRNDKVLTSERWEQVFYESYDYLRVREENPNATDQGDFISKALDFFLNEPFERSFTTQASQTEITSEIVSNLAVIDLKASRDLPFPFYAAVVHGGDLLPLYLHPSLTATGNEILTTKLRSLGVHTPVPERHPIL